MYILKQTNILKYGLITISLILSLFFFYVVIGFLGIQELTKPYPYGTFFTWVIIFFAIFYRFTFLLLTIGIFFGIVNVLEWHWIFAILFTLPSFLFVFPKQFLNFRIKKRANENYRTSYPKQAESKFNEIEKQQDKYYFDKSEFQFFYEELRKNNMDIKADEFQTIIRNF